MRHTTPCFVRVEDVEKRKELFDWLSQNGYNYCDWSWGEYIRVIRCWTTPKGISKAVGYPCKHVRKTDIDCGTDIELFKALAAMNNENDLYQWFVCTSDCWDDVERGDLIRDNGPEDYRLFFEPLFRKATAGEIIEYFKNKKK